MAGGAIAFSRTLDEMFSPILIGLYATPRSVAAPLFIIWLGLGIASKVGVIFLASFFPICINTIAGIKNVEGEFRMLGHAFSISRWAMLIKIIVPGSLPFLIAGLRLGYSRAVVTIVVAELFGSQAGLGYMIDHAAQTYRVAEMMVGISMLTLQKAVLHLNAPIRELGKRGAPRVEQARFMSENVMVWGDAFPDMSAMIDQMIRSASGRAKGDLYRRIGAESARQWTLLAAVSRERDAVVQLGRKPVGARAALIRLAAESVWLPPGLICDTRIELGWTLHLCGDRGGARKELQRAFASAPDTVRRRRAKHYLVQLDKD